MQTFKFRMWQGEEDCHIVLAKYVADGSLAILLESAVDGSPVTTLTTCLYYDDIPVESNYCYIDTNNNLYAEEFIQQNHLGEPVRNRIGQPIYGTSGFCKYPLYKMDMLLLRAACKRNNYDGK